LALVVLGALLGYTARGWLLPPGAVGPAPAEAKPATADEAAVQFWTCSMHPQIRKAEPGSCPICAMPLVPVAAPTEGPGAVPSLRRFATSAEGRALMDIQTSPVERRFAVAEVRLVGKIAYDETRVGYIAAWIPGRLDRLYVDYTGVEVREGDHMVYIYSPELLSAQEELLQALKAARELAASDVSIMRETAEATVVAARDKLRLWGLKEAQIREVEQRGAPSDHITIYAPTGGTVVQKHAQEGMYVQTGTRIYTIADLSQVWVYLDAYESDLGWLRYGQDVTVTTEAYPGEPFVGKIAFIDPVVDPATRTVKVRVNLANLDRKLKPQMFVHGLVLAHVAMGGRIMEPDLAGKWICPMHPEIVKPEAGTCDMCGMDLVTAESLGYVPAAAEESARPLVIPASAPLVTGTRAVVYVEDQEAAQPTFVGREVVLGPRARDYYIVRHGLREGELVVTRGNFKIDSALQIQASPSMMAPEGGGAAGAHYHGGGTLEAAPEGMPQGMQVPAAFQHELHPVQAAYEQVLSAVRGGDLERTRAAFKGLSDAVDGVQAGLVSGHARAMWDELSMLLGNDAFEGREAARFEEVEAVLPLLERHMARLREHFGLSPGEARPTSGGHGHE